MRADYDSVMRTLAPLFLLPALLGPLAVVPASARAQAAKEAQDYDALLREAVREFNELRFLEARSLFLRVHAMRPSARTFRAIGLAEYELGNYVQSAAALSSALSDKRTPLTRKDRKSVRDFLQRSRRYIGRVAVPEGADVVVDGQETALDAEGAVLLNPGKHVLHVAGERYGVDIVGGETIVLGATPAAQQETVAIAQTPEPSAPPSATEHAQLSVDSMGVIDAEESDGGSGAWPAVTVVAGGALVVGGVVVGSLAVAALSDYERDCPPSQSTCGLAAKDEAARIERMALIGDGLWIGGAVVMGAGLLWWLLDDNEAPGTQVSAWVSPQGATATVRGSF